MLDISLSLDIMIRSICFIDGMTIVQLTDEFVNGQTIDLLAHSSTDRQSGSSHLRIC